jgi:hypothetical protein
MMETIRETIRETMMMMTTTTTADHEEDWIDDLDR